jgi:hypothetical protein
VIIAIAIYPSIRIPCGWLSSNAIEICNKIFIQLSLAYVSAYIFWLLTVCAFGWIRRRKFQWWIHDQLICIIGLVQDIDNEIGYDKGYSLSDMSDYLNNANNQYKTFLVKIKALDDRALHLVNMNFPWSDGEIDSFADIHNSCHIIEDNLQIGLQPTQVSVIFNSIKMINKVLKQLDKEASTGIK